VKRVQSAGQVLCLKYKRDNKIRITVRIQIK
jgi:hypothetical protein